METQLKFCSKCQTDKEITDFHTKGPKRKSTWCKKCLHKYQAQRWIQRKVKAVEIMGGKCCCCGYNKNLSALHFHHLRDKDADWGDIRQRAWEKVVEELKKCILLCANCHAEEHNPELNLVGLNNSNPALNYILKSTGKCPNCDDEVYGTKYCSTICSAFANRKVERPSRQELVDETKDFSSFCALGRKYKVSDNAVRKWFKFYDIPVPQRSSKP